MNRFVKALTSMVTAAPERAQGPDISHWDESFNPAIATQRIDFVFFKLTEGTHFVDSLIEEMWHGVKQVPVRAGYHYQRSGFSWIQQADHFLKVASWFDLQALALDVEEINNVYNDAFFSDTRRILQRLREKAPNKKIILYTNSNTYNQLYYAFKRLYPFDGTAFLESFDFWYAWPSRVFNEPILPKTRRNTWRFWQKAWDGKPEEWGTGSAADVNVFNGTRADLAQWAGITALPPTIPPEPPAEPPAPPQVEPVVENTVFTAEVLVDKVIVRTFPRLGEATKTTLRVIYKETFKGKIWPGSDYLWLQITESPRADLIGKWVAVRKSDGSERLIMLKVWKLPPEVIAPQLYRVRHDIELPRGLWRPNMPEVHPIFPNHHSEFDRPWQLLSKAMNPRIDNNRWTACYTFQRYLTNNQGFGMSNDPRANHVLGKNLRCDNPRVEALTTGGSFHSGVENGKDLILDTLDVHDVPTLDWIMARPWFWVYAVTVDGNGTPRRFPQGLQPSGEVVPIIHPLFTDRRKYPKPTIPLSKLEKWDMSKPLPDPFKVYLT